MLPKNVSEALKIMYDARTAQYFARKPYAPITTFLSAVMSLTILGWVCSPCYVLLHLTHAVVQIRSLFINTGRGVSAIDAG